MLYVMLFSTVSMVIYSSDVITQVAAVCRKVSYMSCKDARHCFNRNRREGREEIG